LQSKRRREVGTQVNVLLGGRGAVHTLRWLVMSHRTKERDGLEERRKGCAVKNYFVPTHARRITADTAGHSRC
jgi:hypothetical protein